MAITGRPNKLHEGYSLVHGWGACPVLGVCFLLMAGIVCAHCRWVCLLPFLWLALVLFATGVSVIPRNPTVKSLMLGLAVLAAGGFLDSRQEMLGQASGAGTSAQTYTYNSLGTLDRAKLRVLDLRQQLMSQYGESQAAGQDYAVVCAMTLGDKTALDKNTRHTFSSSGASHVLAVSGLHIGIIFQMLFFLLGGKRSSSLAITISMLSIWGYVFFIGLPASAVRSAFMVSVYCFSLLSLRHSPPLNSLAFAGVVMLLVNPSYLFDVSFQLSFAAVLSILLLYRHLYRLLPGAWCKYGVVKWVWGMVCVSLAAQVGTMPLIAYWFGTVACYSLVSSFVAIPAVTVILYASLLLVVLGVSASFMQGMPVVHMVLAGGCEATMSLLGGTAELTRIALQTITSWPGASVEGIQLNIPQLVCVYVATIAGCLSIHKLLLFHRYRIRLAAPVDKGCTPRVCQTGR